MPNLESLDEVIARKAEEFAAHLQATAMSADKEEEIRIEVERQLAFVQKEAGVMLEGKHEFTVASGRVDSVYDRVLIEYKNPRNPSTRIGPHLDSPGTKKVIDQISRRFNDMQAHHGQPLHSLLGVGLDGRCFVFVRFLDGELHVQDPVQVSKHSVERFLWALLNLGRRGKSFSPDFLAEDFGSDAELAKAGIQSLYEAITSTTHPKAQIFFKQWKILFSEVCGYEVDEPSGKMKRLAEIYGIRAKRPKPAHLLFALHTYYAIFMKLLASEIVAFFHKLPTPLEKILHAPTSVKLRREMDDLEEGGIFRHFNITNFLEGDLFAWYTAAWDDSLQRLVRDMATRLDSYNPGTLSEDPVGSRDLLKKLYQQLFPKSVRHDLGEYYTPDWLAEHVLNQIGYDGDPGKRLLDPACGSGTFLVLAIGRIRGRFQRDREAYSFREKELCRKILDNVVGFDLNPLAVMAARRNYLIAIRDLISHVDRVEIPVYLCDSVLTPAEYGSSEQDEMFGKPMQLRTGATPSPFFIPREVTTDRSLLGKYTNLLADTAPVHSGYGPRDFLARLEEEGVPNAESDEHVRLFTDLRDLDAANKNGVWARIIKNAFAPVFEHPFDFVAGNPPWVNWNNLPVDYRDASKPLWQKFDLWPRYLLGASADLSKLFFYASVGSYLRSGGRIGFVITQSLFKTFGGAQFRQFRLPTKEGIGCIRVEDMVSLQPFEGATNRTSVIIAERGRETTYPVPYIRWLPRERRPSDEDSLRVVERLTLREDEVAVPILRDDLTSPWVTGSTEVVRVVNKSAGRNSYDSVIGIHTYGANGVFFLNKKAEKGKLWIVENDTRGIKTEVEQEVFAIEPDLLVHLARGRDVQRDAVQITQFLLFPYNPEGQILDEDDLRRRFPKGYEFLRKHKEFLSARSEYVRRERKGPWYQLYCVYPGTFSPHKVVWREQSSTLTPAVLTSSDGRSIIPDHKLMFIPCWAANEAYYLYALLRSTVIRLLVESVSIETQNSTRVMDSLSLPRYDAQDVTHTALAALGRRAAVGANPTVDRKIDEATAVIWHIAPEELQLLIGVEPRRATRRA